MKPEYLFLQNAHPNSENLKEISKNRVPEESMSIGHLKSLSIDEALEWTKGNLVDSEFMTAEDKTLFNRLYRDLTGDTYK
jgi:hypothetical protein